MCFGSPSHHEWHYCIHNFHGDQALHKRIGKVDMGRSTFTFLVFCSGGRLTGITWHEQLFHRIQAIRHLYLPRHLHNSSACLFRQRLPSGKSNKRICDSSTDDNRAILRMPEQERPNRHELAIGRPHRHDMAEVVKLRWLRSTVCVQCRKTFLDHLVVPSGPLLLLLAPARHRTHNE